MDRLNSNPELREADFDLEVSQPIAVEQSARRSPGSLVIILGLKLRCK